MQRYFALENEKTASLSKEDAHHLLVVMRAKVGEEIEIVKDGKCAIYEIVSLKPLAFEKRLDLKTDNELLNKVTLYYCLVKGDKMDLVIQKAVELGVDEIVLLESERTIVRLDSSDHKKKIERYASIAKGAAMQSKRNVIPKIEKIVKLNELTSADLKDRNFVAYEEVAGTTKQFKTSIEQVKQGESISILIGTEGGFTPKEITQMKKIGFKEVSLGKRILRSETAAISALSIVSFLLEAL